MTNEPRTLFIDRRTLLGGFAAALVAPRHGFAATAADATGRTITAPDRVTRVYPAGPPAAVLLYTLAPDLLIGWLEPLGAAEREFLLPEVAARPQVPRLTGRGGAVNLEAVNSLKPDLIVDAGTVNASFKALAETTQQQTGIPYALFDGRFEQIVPTYRALGETRRPRRGSGKTRALCRRHDDDRQGAERRRAERRAAARLLRPRQERPRRPASAVR